MLLLALDIGNRRTGVALADDTAGFVMALDTIHHKKEEELIDAIDVIVKKRQISELIVGLPRLPGGEEGSQAVHVRAVVEKLTAKIGIPVTLIDERFSTHAAKNGSDPDAAAACSMLDVILSQRKK